ncbi:MAG: serine/threonine protein kinase, partial [Solirubrobacteraceae bacterium]|nr:serine/threonine protein kinase [Solirubrobacteraceae bacterium]
AHGRGVVHRDIKPANVMIPDNAESEAAIVKLTDFGVARLAGDDTITRNGDIVGTFSYMAPEQAEGLEAVEASDLYSLGLVLYEALSGVNPVRGETPAETARNVGTELPPLYSWRPDLPGELCEAIDRAVCIDPDYRGTVVELRDELELSLDRTAPETLPPPPAWPAGAEAPVLRPRPVRRPVSVGERAMAAAAGALVCGAAVAALPADAPLDHGSAPIAALAAAIACGLLPRAGTLLAVAGLVVTFVACGVAGWAVLLLAAFLPGLLLMPRDGASWLLPAGAPALGMAGISLAFPAFAGQASAPGRRAVLGGLGLWWLLLAEPVASPVLLLGDPAGMPAAGVWQASVSATVGDVLVPIVASGAPLIALVLAAAAWALPALPVGHRSIADLAFLAVWAGGLAAATALAASALSPAGQAAPLRGLVAGAAAAALVALVAVAVRPRE